MGFFIFTKKLYREIGNFLQYHLMKRKNIKTRIRRGTLLVDLCNKYNIVNEGDKLLEIGTGWIHFVVVLAAE